MFNNKKLKEEIEFNDSLSTFTQVYQELSVMKIQKIRTSVLYTRKFIEKLSEVFYNVKVSYDKQVEMFAKQKIQLNKEDPKKNLPFKKNGKKVAVLLSANTKLFGDLIVRIFNLFIEHVRKYDCDVIIIGKRGRQLYDEVEKKKKYLYFEISDFEVRSDDLKPIVYHLVNYESILVFYGVFYSFIEQAAVSSNITGDTPVSINTQHKDKMETDRFLFEPSITSVLTFFETQLFSGLFKQAVNESELARFASRIKAMESAHENLEEARKIVNIMGKRLHRRTGQKKQLESITGISLWRR